MAELNIPTEVKDKSAFPQLKKIDRQIICAAVLMGLPNQDAFLLHHPEYAISTGKGKYRISDAGAVESKHFWSYSKNREYREVYETELAEFLGRKQTNRSELSDIDDNRKGKALKALLNRAMSLVEDNAELDPDALKTLTEIFKKTGLLKDDVEQEVRPIRVLPARCSECRYKAFIESPVLDGSAIDCCAYCKARKVAEEHGYRFNDGKDLLEIPEDVIKELEEKNDIKLTDILSGKIEN